MPLTLDPALPPFQPGDALSLGLFLGVVVATLGMIVLGASRAGSKRISAARVGVFLAAWVALLSAVVASGELRSHLVPGVPLFFAAINVGALVFGLSPWGRQLSTLPVWQLVAFQGFRLPLEIVLHLWAESGTVPPTMTWTGQNYDVLSGMIAWGALIPRARNRAYAWVANGVGIVLLLNVLRVVTMSSPFPFSWKLERPLQLALHLPYAWIGIVCVWAAIAGHVVLTRALLRK